MQEKSTTKPVGNHFALSQIDTLHCQQKELEHKGGQRQHHDAYYVAAAVGKKAHLGMKHIALSIVEFCLADGIS